MKEEIKFPSCALSHDESGGRLRIDVEIPDVNKDDIRLEMRKNSFCVSAPIYSRCFMLTHEIEPEKTEAKYENGLLRIFSPIKDWERRVVVHVQ
jgi:HSP20 family molecular chaperone IbpA